jgi:hypothetical protein
MINKIRRVTLGMVSAALIGAGGVATADPLEAVTSLDVERPGAFLAALDRYYSSDGATGNVVIWSVTFAGQSDTTHLAIGNFDDYADYEKVTNDRDASPAWGAFVGSIRDSLDVESRLMAIERFRMGSGWEEHGAMAAFVMTISDPATYMDAFTDMAGSTDNPGSIRLMELRFGGQGATHAALISAPDVAALNEYLDDLLSSSVYRDFASQVRGIRTIQNVQMLRRVRSYGN